MPATTLFVLLSLMQYISVSFQRGRVTCDESSCAIIHTVLLRLIYEIKIQVLTSGGSRHLANGGGGGGVGGGGGRS